MIDPPPPGKTSGNPVSKTTEARPSHPGTAPPSVQLDDSDAQLCYANFCRVSGTPEELVLDFGLNDQPYGQPTRPIKVQQRLVVNYFTAKRMLNALAASVQRHEQAFGALETDVQKRVVLPPMAGSSAATGSST